jgi:outer membrane protein assembly factor BamB
VACFAGDLANCPEERGPDHDFGRSPILVSLRDGWRVLVTGQKSGVVHALDPDQDGKILWQTRVGVSGFLRAYATAAARLLGEFDAVRDYATVNGVPVRWMDPARSLPTACSM